MKSTSQKFFFSFLLNFVFLTSLFAEPMIVPSPPSVDASSYLLMDFQSGKYLVENNMDERLPPASLTKIMTVYVVASELANGNISLDDEVLISEKAWRIQGSKMFIEVNKRVKLDDLLHGVIIQSGNDASVALAEHVSGSEEVFADLMNRQAARLGMNNTHFENATGWPHENHYTTAHDLAILARALIHDFPDIYSYHKIKEFTFNNIKQHNRNSLLYRDRNVDGVKTGHTEEAGYCLVASAMEDDMRLISVVMGTNSENARTIASQSLLSYGFRFYETHQLYKADDKITEEKVWKGTTDTVKLGVGEDVFITVPRGQYDKLEPVVDVKQKLIAPIEQGAQQGELTISLAGEKLMNMPLISLETVPEAGFFKRMKDEVLMLIE